MARIVTAAMTLSAGIIVVTRAAMTAVTIVYHNLVEPMF